MRPNVVAVLGATAAKALLGSGFRVTKQRGELLSVDFAPAAVATFHPSAVLRADNEDRSEAFADLVADLRVVSGAA